MDLSDLPQFTIAEIQEGPTPGEHVLVGRFSHLRGLRNERGWLYRHGAVSLVGDLRTVPGSSDEQASFITSDAALAPELSPGLTYPWLDGYWDPRHVAMVLAPEESWRRRTFARVARYDAVHCPAVGIYAVPDSLGDVIPYYAEFDAAGRAQGDSLLRFVQATVAESRVRFAQFPQNRVVEIRGGNHFLFLQRPVAVARTTRSFFSVGARDAAP